MPTAPTHLWCAPRLDCHGADLRYVTILERGDRVANVVDEHGLEHTVPAVTLLPLVDINYGAFRDERLGCLVRRVLGASGSL